MSHINFQAKAIEHIKQGKELQEQEDISGAISKYTIGVELLHKAAQYEKNKNMKKILIQKANSYIDESLRLKEIIRSNQVIPSKKGGVQNNSAKKKNQRVKASEDDDNKKLEDSLNSAIVVIKPNVKWEDIAGIEHAKSMLIETVFLPKKFPNLFLGERKPWKAILLYGPPGTGKSYLAKALATEADSTFFSVSSSDLVSKYLGESERLVRTLFEEARKKSPSIIFIDEIDSLCGSRTDNENDATRRIKTEFLVQMQGVGSENNNLLILGATNTPWTLDNAVRRRFEKRIYIPLPDKAARAELFRILTKRSVHSLTDEDFDKLAEMTEGFSGSDIDSMNREALFLPLRRIMKSCYFRKELPEEAELFRKNALKNRKTNEENEEIEDENEENSDYYLPCEENDPGAIKMTVMDIPENKVRVKDISYVDYVQAIQNTSPSVSQNDIRQYINWTAEFGMEGA